MATKVKQFCKMMKISAAYLYQLEMRGVLPERPFGIIPPEYARMLVEHRRSRGLPLPENVDYLLRVIEDYE
jgi:hypothetical protein